MVVPLISIILLCPLAAFAFFGLLSLTGRNYSRQDLISTAAMLIAAICSFLLLPQITSHPEPISITWIEIDQIKLSMGFYFDSVTAMMLLVVTIVSSLVHIFSIGYMHGDPRYPRFFAFLSLFSFSMLFLVVSDNLLGIYIGWELVGLCSYLLIGFWFEKDSAADACKKAFLTTRVGDVGMFVGMMMLFTKFHTFALYGEGGIFAAVANLGSGDIVWLSIAGVLIFCGAIGKSAQVPLHTWLPDAMEGPTPVSALIHAATMVAAGVYLTARMFPILTPDSSLTIAYVGGITAIVAATIAIVRFDIKRVLAYSTISQLGFMMLGIGAGSYVAGLFHLTTHAFFKALLFLGSGSVIHALAVHNGSHGDDHDHESEHHDAEHGETEHHDDAGFDSHGIPAEQDMRHMGGLRRKMPITFLTMLIATLSISGVPFVFSGFWSKDAILAGVLGSRDGMGFGALLYSFHNRARRRRYHRLLYVPSHLHDLLRHTAQQRDVRPRTRVAGRHGGSVDRSGGSQFSHCQHLVFQPVVFQKTCESAKTTSHTRSRACERRASGAIRDGGRFRRARRRGRWSRRS